VRVEHAALLAAVRARRDPDGTCPAPLLAQVARFVHEAPGQRDVEFEVARDLHARVRRAEVAQALRVRARLSA
jgi:hypothetical protein